MTRCAVTTLGVPGNSHNLNYNYTFARFEGQPGLSYMYICGIKLIFNIKAPLKTFYLHCTSITKLPMRSEAS